MYKKQRLVTAIAVTLAAVMPLTNVNMARAEPVVEVNGDAEYVSTEIPELITQSGGVEEGEIEPNAAAMLAETDATDLTYTGVYDAMWALKGRYPEGMTWTNFEPYGTRGDQGNDYKWKGGVIKGADRGVGCAAFVFILSDEAFGTLPARAIDGVIVGDDNLIDYGSVRVGDILRIRGNSHFVIVLQKGETGVVVAEANYNKSVHWGRTLSKGEVEHADFMITRYPKNFVPADDKSVNEIIQQGKEDDLGWTLTKGGVLTISGNGALRDYESTSLPTWNTYNDQIHSIVIGEGVNRIGNFAFYGSNALSVYIPKSVTEIGDSSFMKSGLIAVTLPDTVTSIGNDVFCECEGLTSVSFTDGLEKIGERAFKGCTSLGYVDFPSSMTSLGSGAFMSCKGLAQVRFRPSKEPVALGADLFTQCWNLMWVTLPSTLTYLAPGMFSNCNLLTSIYIPATITEIKLEDDGMMKSPFMGSGLRTIYFGGSKEAWEKMASNPQITAPLQQNNTKIEYDVAFTDPFAIEPNDPGDLPNMDDGHKHVWSTDWTNNDENAHWHACTVSGCHADVSGNDVIGQTGYEKHIFGDWVVVKAATATEDGSRYRDCSICGYRQTEVIGATGGSDPSPSESPSPAPSESPAPSPSESPSPTSAPSGSPTPSPSGSPSPTSVPSGSPTPVPSVSPVPSPSESPSPLPTSSPSLGEGKTFTSSKVTYQVTKSGKEVELKKIRSTSSKMTVNTVTGTDGVEYKVTSIAPNAMKDNKKLKNLTIGDNVKHIKANAFAGCTNLKTVNIGKNVTTIRSGAFKGCTSLKKAITLPDSIKKIGSGAFAGCTNLKTVNIGGTSRSDLTRIRKNAFNGCEKLSKVTIKSTKLRSVEEKAFKGTRSDLKVKVPSKQLTKYRKMLKNAGLKAKQVTK